MTQEQMAKLVKTRRSVRHPLTRYEVVFNASKDHLPVKVAVPAELVRKRRTFLQVIQSYVAASYTPEGLPAGVALAGPLAVALLGIYAWATNGWITFAIAMAMAGAAGLIGIFLGFLFGIPRYVAGAKATRNYDVNTNLEQISDWLTKIIVGLTLVEIGNWGPALGRLGTTVGSAMMGDPTAPNGADIVALSTMIFFGILGFMMMYLVTRTKVLEKFMKEEERLNAFYKKMNKDDDQEAKVKDAIEALTNAANVIANGGTPLKNGQGQGAEESLVAKTVTKDGSSS